MSEALEINGGLIFRRYAIADALAVRRLHFSALEEAGLPVKPGAFDLDIRSIERTYIEPGGEFLVGLIENDVVAMGGLVRATKDRGEIKRMRVAAPFQRRGFGFALLDRLVAHARFLGLHEVVLDTSPLLGAAIALYLKAGFQETGRGVVDDGVEAIFFAKDLT